jgi:uncharacterized protein (TIGR00725 family)
VGSGEQPLYIGVVGAGEAGVREAKLAEEVGGLLGSAGVVLLCGGMTGVMEFACKGAHEAGGTTVGILPGATRDQANPYVSVALPTALGEIRNALIVRASDAVIAISGEYGTLSEIALALKTGVPVVGIETWDLARGRRAVEGFEQASSPAEAVEKALERARARVGKSAPR